MRDKILKIIKYLLPLIFIAYIGANTLFMHVHKVNGKVIVHSHPFKGNHNHSTIEFETISILSIIISDGTLPFFVSFLPLLILLRVILSKKNYVVYYRRSFFISLRAPPSPCQAL